MDSVPSRVEDILLALINNSEYDGPIISRVEQILYSFLENSEYAADPESRVEAILVALKAAGLYDDEVISRIEKILYSKINGTEYTAEPESRVEELLLEWELSEEKELTGVVPLLFNAIGEQLIDYTIYGNIVQSATPTPNNPIIPEGTGERTGNLFDKDATDTNNGYMNSKYIGYDGNIGNSANHNISEYIEIPVGSEHLTISNVSESVYVYCQFYDSSKNAISIFRYDTIPRIVSIPSNAKYIRCSISKVQKPNFMLNLGSTPLPYEPYGIKIPISSASTTTPVYLGEVETTRKIKKLVLTGEESWSKDSDSGQSARYYITISDIENSTTNLLSSHFTQSAQYEIGTMRGYRRTIIFSVDKTIYATDADFKSYLAAQYANGTPVTVWYVLATLETGIVNEPLMKIGDYADTVSMGQAGVEIPTNNGSNTLDVLTTVKPSEVYIKYKWR